MKLLGVLMISFMAVDVHGNKYGAPSCVDKPNHIATEAQTSPSPYDIKLGKVGEKWILTLGSDDGPIYKGLLLTVLSSGSLRPTSGEFVLFKSVNRKCPKHSDRSLKKAWTHTQVWSENGGSKSEWEYIPDEGSNEEPKLSVILVQNYSTYWTDITITPNVAPKESIDPKAAEAPADATEDETTVASEDTKEDTTPAPVE